MLGLAAVVGGVAIFFADMWISKNAAPPPAEVRMIEMPAAPAKVFKTIVVASSPLTFGETIKREQLVEIPWAEGSVPEGASETVDGLLKAGDRIVLANIQTNEPVLLSKLSGPGGKATLSTLLGPGMRAVPIRKGELGELDGLVAAGDRVDLVLTRDAGRIAETETNAENAAGSSMATEVVIENVKVLTVAQTGDGDTGERSAVTVEVTPSGAQKITLARSVGTLSLALRGVDNAETSSTGVTTISSFLGSAISGIEESVRSINAEEEKKPKMKTVIVTRGVETQSYSVVSPSN
ncbi:MAG: Flp pilus assembly protein CpaB [Phyllobacteriaceae bacterium]|nr:Flp pilus assembly protein CpaB [Phyllobacteriaceae bacterium]